MESGNKHKQPFNEVEMMFLANLAYYLVPGGIYKKDGTAVEALPFLDMLESSVVEKDMYEFFGNDAFEKFKSKISEGNYRIVMAIDDAFDSGLEAIAIEGPECDTVTITIRGSESAHDWIITNLLGLGLLAENDQQDSLDDFMYRLKDYRYIYLTGHSLGGNLAVSGAVGFDEYDKIKGVYTYNAPGQNAAYFLTHLKRIRNVSGKILNFQNDQDWVSDINHPVGKTMLIQPKGPELEAHSLDNLKFEGDVFTESEKWTKGLIHNCVLVGTSILTAGTSGALLLCGVGSVFMLDSLGKSIKALCKKIPVELSSEKGKSLKLSMKLKKRRIVAGFAIS